MNNSPDDSALGARQRAVRSITVFLAMAIVEWRKLVAEIAHALSRSRDRRRASNPKDEGP